MADRSAETKTRARATARRRIARREPRAETVCVTGSSRYWGERLVRRLENAGRFPHIIGFDTQRPAIRFRKAKTYTVDFKDPAIVEILQGEKVKTLVHLYFVPRTRRSEMAFQDNVLGTMNLFAACAKAGVKKIIFKSSARVYGARPDNPLYMKEDRFLRADPSFQYSRDLFDIELFTNGFRRRHPKITFTTLRFSGIVGPTAKTPWTLYLGDTVVPTALGYDPLVQVLHEDDVEEVLHHCIVGNYRGSYNVAGDGVFYLSQAIRRAGRTPLPLLTPLTAPLFTAARTIGLMHFAPFELEYMKFPWLVDTSRMRDEMKFKPRWTGADALRSIQRAFGPVSDRASEAGDES